MELRLSLSPWAPPVGAFFHSNLGDFLYSRKRRWLLARAQPANLRALLLSDSIRDLTLERVPEFGRHCHVVPHPCPQGIEYGEDSDWDRIRFAYLGLASRAKGFDDLLRLAGDVIAEGAQRAWLESIGFCPEEYREPVRRVLDAVGAARDRLALPPTMALLPVEEYRARLASLSYVVMTYSPEAYRFTCRGAALDAVAAARPIIAYDTTGLRELFAKMGDIGYLCRNYEEMLTTVRRIAADPPRERYLAQRSQLRLGRELFGTEAVAEALARALGLGRVT